MTERVYEEDVADPNIAGGTSDAEVLNDEVELEGDAAAPEEGEQSPAPEAEEKPHKGIQKRINELTRARRESDAKYEAAQQYIAELQQKLDAAPKPTADKPDRDDFDDNDDYIAALAEWKADQAVAARLEKQLRETQNMTMQQQVMEQQRRWNEAEDKVMAEIDDYQEVIDLDFVKSWPNEVRKAIFESDVGPRVMYHLCQNPSEVSRIARLSPINQIKAIGLVENSLSTKPTSKAPAPVNRLRGSNGAFIADETKLSDEDWLRKQRTERMEARRRRR